MKRLLALLLLCASPAAAQVTTFPIDSNTLILPNLVVANTLTIGTQFAIGANGGASGVLTLNGSTSGSASLVATSAGGLSVQPTLGSGIAFNDGPSNTVLTVLGVGASGVNGLYIKDAATGNPAVIGAVGSDTNIGIQMIAKGTSSSLGFQIIQSASGGLVPLQAGGTSSGTGTLALSGNTSGEFSIVGTPTGGHAAMTSNTTPTLGVCNGTGSANFGSDVIGSATAKSSGASTQCTVTFATAFANPPFCMVTASGGFGAISNYTTTASVLTVNFPSTTGQQFVYYCFGL